MAARSIASGTVSFGLVSIPIKVFSAGESKAAVSFNLLHGKCKSRLKQQYNCPACNETVARDHPHEAQYVVPFAFKVRWRVTLNLREAVHLCELRSMPQGHPDYRLLVQEMWKRIEEAHPALAPWGKFVNRDTDRLGRLQSEMRTEYKRATAVP